jgi:hypothetical protein
MPPSLTTGAGAQSISISDEQFVLGMGTADNTHDGGFSPSSYGFNLTVSPGLFQSTKNSSTIQSGLTGINFISGCEYDGGSTYTHAYLAQTVSTYFYYILNQTSGYAFTGGTWSINDTSGNTYLEGVSDMISFLNYIYTTTLNGDITLINPPTTFTPNWWTTTKSQGALITGVPHPLHVYNNRLYIGNGYMLASWDGTTIINPQLTLASDKTITAIGTDPSTRNMIIAGTTYSGVPSGQGYVTPGNWIGLYDGTNPTQVIGNVIPVEEKIITFKSLGGQLYAFSKRNMYLWTGAGLKFIINLSATSFTKDTTVEPLKHRVATSENALYVVNGNNLLCYKEVLNGGQKVFSNILNQSANLQLISSLGAGCIGFIAFGADTFNYFDTTKSATSNTGVALFQSNVFNFPRPARIRGIDISTSGSIGTGNIVVSLVDDTGTSTTVSTITSALDKHWRDTTFNIQTTSVVIKAMINNSPIKINRIVIYYDYAE